MSILSAMPIDGGFAGRIVVGDTTSPGASLAWDLVRPLPAGLPPGIYTQPQGRISARIFQVNFDHYIVTQDSDYDPGLGTESHYLYWLPWADGQVTSVTWAALANSNANRFLTSTFSGCRFVVNNTGLAHVAWGNHPNFAANGSTLNRSLAELSAGSGNPTGGGLRRTLSITGAVPGRATEKRVTYNENNERCVVMGYKNGQIWTFKCLKMRANGPMFSRWSTLAVVDMSTGAPVIQP